MMQGDSPGMHHGGSVDPDPCMKGCWGRRKEGGMQSSDEHFGLTILTHERVLRGRKVAQMDRV